MENEPTNDAKKSGKNTFRHNIYDAGIGYAD